MFGRQLAAHDRSFSREVCGIYLIEAVGQARQSLSMPTNNDDPSISEKLMNPIIRISAVCATLGLTIGAPALPAIAQQPAVLSQTFEATATVETVDAKTRQMLLKTEDGHFLTLVAGPQVRNFAQIKSGDRIYARYESELAARMGKPDETMLTDQDLVGGGRADRGAKPAGEEDLEVRRKITVSAIDLEHNLLRFLDAGQVTHVVQVRSPPMRAFLRTLKPGDIVDVTFREAEMVEVTPAK